MSRRRGEPDSVVAHFDGLRQDYAFTQSSRYRRRRSGVAAMGSGADYHIRHESDYLRGIEQARDLERNDVIGGVLLERAETNTVQLGYNLDAKSGDTAIDKDLEARWLDWAEDPNQCDVAGELTFHDMEGLTFRSVLRDGDTLALPLEIGSLQLAEGHRLRTPRNAFRRSEKSKIPVHGIMVDEQRRHLEYWLTRDDIDPSASLNNIGDVVKYAARGDDGHKQVFHLCHPKRVSQTRGITAFAPVFDIATMFEDLNFANLVRAQVASCIAFFRERGEMWTPPGGDSRLGARETTTRPDGSTRLTEQLSPGMEVFGEKGEKIHGFSPNLPNPEFFPHVKLILTLLGVNFGLPLVLVLLDASETNFSGWRGAIDQARIGFRRNQKWHKGRFHTPVYRWKVRQWLAEDSALERASRRDGINIFGHRWNLPIWPYIEPLKDATADNLRLANGHTTPSQFFAERHGRDAAEVYAEMVDDYASAIEYAMKKAAELNGRRSGQPPVHWRDLLRLPTPQGVTVDLDALLTEKEEPAA